MGRWDLGDSVLNTLYCDRCGCNEDKIERYGQKLRHVTLRQHYHSGPLRAWSTDFEMDFCDKCFDELREMGMRSIGYNHYELPDYISAYAPATRKSALYKEHASHNFRY